MPETYADRSEDRSQKKTVLLIENDNRLRAALADTIRAMGYEVYSTANSLEALAAMEGIMASVGLVITDLEVPGMNAEKLYEALKAKDYRGMMLIMTSDRMSEMGIRLAERPDVVRTEKRIENEALRLVLAQTVGKPTVPPKPK